VVNRFAVGLGRKGVDLGGKAGQPIKAAAAGEVVYSGKGLIGYGNLVIIKHDEIFLSAYGHNRKLLVKEGAKVKAGQLIGEMGQSAKIGSMLHFEIRRNGKPVDPLLYLPNQTQ
jgi:lipoprotein NlpD